jgi:acylphosphatase
VETIAVRLVIRGHVQGVGYRWWARTEAERLGLQGWVRNRASGAVELVASGPAAMVETLISACRQGPAGARVSSIERLAADPELFQDFQLRPTA